jgi:hypothetical protein
MTNLNEVKFSDNNVLTCPHCGFDYLHQGAVRTYNRAEDADETIVTTVDAEGSATARVAYTHNPSDRRHGLAIAFGCEGCGQLFELTVAQSKGRTLVKWRGGRTIAQREDELAAEVFFPPLADEPQDPGPH